MSGSEANSSDDPEIILGLRSQGDEGKGIPRPPPVCGGWALAMVLLGPAVGWVAAWVMQAPQDGSGAAWSLVGPISFLAVCGVACLIGTILSIRALWRLERWPILAALALALEGGFLATVVFLR